MHKTISCYGEADAISTHNEHNHNHVVLGENATLKKTMPLLEDILASRGIKENQRFFIQTDLDTANKLAESRIIAFSAILLDRTIKNYSLILVTLAKLRELATGDLKEFNVQWINSNVRILQINDQ
jgi:hypothetical protein